MKRMIIGYGNQLRGDDGAAWELARRAEALGWETLTVVQLTPELVDTLSPLDEVVFADATHEPGPLRWYALDPIEGQGWPAHCGEPERLLDLCHKLHGRAPQAWMLTLPGEDFGYRLGLSEFSQASIEQGLDRLALIWQPGDEPDSRGGPGRIS